MGPETLGRAKTKWARNCTLANHGPGQLRPEEPAKD